MYLRLIIALLLPIIVSPFGGEATEAPPLWKAAVWLGGAVAVLLSFGIVGRLHLRGLARRGAEFGRLLKTYSRLSRLGGLLWLALYLAVLYAGGWGDAVLARWSADSLVTTELVLVAPLAAILPAAWWSAYRMSRVILWAAPPGVLLAGPQQTGFARYVVFHLRQYVLVIFAPLVFFLGVTDIAYYVVGPSETAEVVALAVAMPAILLGAPVMLRLTWSTERLAAGPLREKLLAVADRAGVRIDNVILWRTHGLMVNASMAGVGWPVRYVFLTDSLLDHFRDEQVEGIFGHELGHARYHHIPFFVLVAMTGGMVANLVHVAVQVLAWNAVAFYAFGEPVTLADVAFAAVLLAYWGVFFGMLSRRFEAQSDLFGARTVICPGEHDPIACPVHRPDAEADPHHICRYQAWAFTSALERIAVLNGVSVHKRSWRHGSIARRMERVALAVDRPDAVARFDRGLRRFKLAFLLVALVLLAANLLIYTG